MTRVERIERVLMQALWERALQLEHAPTVREIAERVDAELEEDPS